MYKLNTHCLRRGGPVHSHCHVQYKLVALPLPKVVPLHHARTPLTALRPVTYLGSIHKFRSVSIVPLHRDPVPNHGAQESDESYESAEGNEVRQVCDEGYESDHEGAEGKEESEARQAEADACSWLHLRRCLP